MPADPTWHRTLRAFALAPLVAPLLYACALVTIGVARALDHRAGSIMRTRDVVAAFGGALVFGGPIAYLAALVLGVPAILWARRRGGGRPPLSVLALAGTGAGWLIARWLAPSLRGELFSVPFPLWAGALLGALTAAAFWCLLPDGKRDGTS